MHPIPFFDRVRSLHELHVMQQQGMTVAIGTIAGVMLVLLGLILILKAVR
jgi:hypothetical protein